MKNPKMVGWTTGEIRSRYDVVIIGAGVHGLAAAYYLAKRGLTRVAVVDKTYLGGGNSGRNTQIIRANQRTPENVRLYDEALRLWGNLSRELDFNLLIDQKGLTTLAHNEFSLERLRLRTEVNQAMGVVSKLIGRRELAELHPYLDLSDKPRFPIVGAQYHPLGGNVRHNAAVWGFSRSAIELGVEIFPHTEITAIRLDGNEIAGVSADGKEVSCDCVVNATAGWCSTIAQMVNIRLPIVTTPLQACVTEPYKPFMNGVIMSADLAAYFYQTERGEIVIGAEIDPYSSYSYNTTLQSLEIMGSAVSEFVPRLALASVVRSWAGICDITPDFSPILGFVPSLKGFVLDCGWGTYGFKIAPAAGKEIAELIAVGKTPETIEPFSLTRFYENKPVDEKASAGTAH